MMRVENIVAHIKKGSLSKRPIIIAIEGFGGAGKSTFAANLKRELGEAYVIDMDNFFLKEKMSDAIKSNFDRKRLEDQVLLPLKNGQPAAYQKLEYATNTLSNFIKLPSVKYLIIEGVSSFHPEIAHYMDYKIWIDTPVDVADARGRKRDKELGNDNGALWDNWTKTYQDYKDMYSLEAAADFIFDNS